ncbi:MULTISPECIES: MFS transporter [Allobacillus]|uniref:MFS transporter n=1 Tax=Allobacillus salarius TaxID=1955272 RepID=A0A556PTJ7_9BACI|nr:MFS transporter [Allobacillus salarius]TSJ67702.1 MFS transporter [Allobacillus salarius]
MKLRHRDDVTEYERKNLFYLLAISALYTLGLSMSNIFVNIFLWKQSHNIELLAVYNISIYLTQLFIFIIAGKWVKRFDRVIILRVGIILISLFFIGLLSLGSHASSFYVLLGAILGAGYGFYLLAFNVLTFEVTEPHTRDYFNSTMGTLQSIAWMIGPLFAGYLITVLSGFKGYLTIFFLSFLLFLLAVITSIFLERRRTSGQYIIRRAIQERKENPNWYRMMNAHFLQGFRDGVFLFAVGLWVFMITDREMTIGIYNFIYAGGSLLVYQLLNRWLKPSKRKRFIFIGSVALYIAVIWIIYANTAVDLYIYGMMIGLSFPLFFAPFMSISYDVIGQARNARDYRVEYVVFKEIILNFGRVISLVLFWLGLQYFHEIQWLRYSLLLFGLGYLFAMLQIRKIE